MSTRNVNKTTHQKEVRKMSKMKCAVCGYENEKKSGQCHKCGTSLKKPLHIRLNLFRRIKDAETAIAKTQYAMFKLHRS